MTLKTLREFLAGVSAGEIRDTSTIERMLFGCWHEFNITSDDSNLEPYKLLSRTEALTWNPPILEFDIERHGATVKGSIYAEVHHWKVNVVAAEASMEIAGRRQVGTKAKVLDVEPLAKEIASLILHHKLDARLIWKADQLVRLDIGKIIRTTNQQTTSARRRRFKIALESELTPHGWKRTSQNTFAASGGVGSDPPA